MKREGIGRGRLIMSAGALVVVAGAIPTWWRAGGTVTAMQSGNGFGGAGIAVFASAILMLALVVLPYARRAGEAWLDRRASYVVLAAIATGAFAVRLLEIDRFSDIGTLESTPGIWLTAAGLAVVAWGTAELLVERPAR